MPVYRYLCACGGWTEQRVPVEERHTAAPTCSCGQRMELTVLSPGVQFKGQGWTPKFGPVHF